MSCSLLNRDQSTIVQDFGPGGYVGNTVVNLPFGLKPGSVISVVATSDQHIAINIKDAKSNILIHVVARVQKNDYGLNSHLDGKWGSEEKVPVIPVHRGIRCTTNIVYEEFGYRIFVNGAFIAFYTHRSKAPAHLVEVDGAVVFKVVYLTTKDLVPQ